MKRGDIYLVAGQVGPAGKPRPCLVVQRTSTLDGAPKVTLCPVTSSLRATTIVRPLIHPTDANGLMAISQVEIDWIYTYAIARLGKRIGSVDDGTMRQVDIALRRWLDV